MDYLNVQDAPDGAKKKKIKPGSFQSMDLIPPLFKAIMKLGYKQPTPIQRKTIPSVIQGHDVVAMSRTGSGKTAAFLIPIFNRLKLEHSVVVGVRAMILSPTRELALQTAKFCRSFNAYGSLRICILVGGQGMEQQFAHLAQNPDIIIATPGRMMHHIVEAELSLQRVETLVFDEADRLFELGFQEQLEKILEASAPTRQCLLFSATLPAQLVSFSKLGMRDPILVRLDVETTLSDNLSLQYVHTRQEERIGCALFLARTFMGKDKSGIFFVATRHHVEFFATLFKQAGLKNVFLVYGNMDQTARETEIHNFRKNKGILVTTDIAARGIDIPLLDLVINFDFPSSSKLFVHRAGRTARAGKDGLCLSLVTLDDLPYCLDLLLFLGRKLRLPHENVEEGVIGSMPPLDDDLETVKRLFADNDANNDLPTLHKSMMAAYKLYFKMRNSASKTSVRRAKELIAEIGGAAKLQSMVHPLLENKVGKIFAMEQNKRAFIDELRSFRPSLQKGGFALSTDVMQVMGNKRSSLSTVKLAAEQEIEEMMRKEYEACELEMLQPESDDSDIEMEEEKNETSTVPTNKENVKKVKKVEKKKSESKIRMSKRARKKMGSGHDAENNISFGGYSVKIDGKAIGKEAAAKDAKKFPDASPGKATSSTAKPPTLTHDIFEGGKYREDFYVSVEQDTYAKSKEEGLQLDRYQIDLVADDQSNMKKQKSVMRWDAKKKKYLPVLVNAEGKVMRKETRRNESGQKMKGVVEKSDLYSKWSKQSKGRIQKVGEMEISNPGLLNLRAKNSGGITDFGGDSDDDGPSDNTEGDGKKPIVPFHGIVEDKHLTNKQKRMKSKRDGVQSSKVTAAGKGLKARKEIKNVDDLKKTKNVKLKHKLKTNKKFRKEHAKQQKDAWWERHSEKIAKRAARPRSFVMPVKEKKKRRSGKKEIYLK